MPIKPENKGRYPKDWKRISAAIRERSGGRCECCGECGLHNGSDLFVTAKRCDERHGHPAQWASGVMIMTVAHLCHNKECSNPRHLKGLCQRCHLRYDIDLHIMHSLESKGMDHGSVYQAARSRQAEQARKVRADFGPCIVSEMRIGREGIILVRAPSKRSDAC